MAHYYIYIALNSSICWQRYWIFATQVWVRFTTVSTSFLSWQWLTLCEKWKRSFPRSNYYSNLSLLHPCSFSSVSSHSLICNPSSITSKVRSISRRLDHKKTKANKDSVIQIVLHSITNPYYRNLQQQKWVDHLPSMLHLQLFATVRLIRMKWRNTLSRPYARTSWSCSRSTEGLERHEPAFARSYWENPTTLWTLS